MDTVNGDMPTLLKATGALMTKESKRILVAIIIVILIVIAEFVTNGQPVYEKPPQDDVGGDESVLLVETLEVPEIEEKPVKQPVAAQKPKPAPTPAPPSGDWVTRCKRWAEMAGVPLNSWAIELIGRESSCNPTVWNYGGSGAGGIPQALPASKMGCGMTWADADAICQLRWMENYVFARYGSWQNAVAFHDRMNWY